MKHLQELLIRLGLTAIGVLTLSVLTVGAVQAMPSFSRQTGMSCNQCHFTHDPTPSFTIQAMKFRANGYRFAERRTKLLAGQPGAEGGETLDIPWDDYLSYRFESVVANKSQAPGQASTELTSNPTTRLAWFVTGPVTKNIGFWNEFYIVGDYGANNCSPSTACTGGSTWAPGLVTWDEYDLVYTINPDAIQDNGDIYNIRFTNQGLDEEPWGPNQIGAPSAIGPRGELDGNAHPNLGAFRFTAWMHDRWVWQLGAWTGDNNSGWDQKMEDGDIEYYFDNRSDNTVAARIQAQTGDDEIPYVTTDALQEGANQNPLVYTYHDAITGISATRACDCAYLNTDLKNNVAVDPTFRWQRSDVGDDGDISWAWAIGLAYGRDEYTDGASFTEELFGTGLIWCYAHTHCLQPTFSHTLKYTFTDHNNVSYDVPEPNSYSLSYVYQPAMNFAVVVSLSTSSTTSLTGPAKTGGWSFSTTLDFPM